MSEITQFEGLPHYIVGARAARPGTERHANCCRCKTGLHLSEKAWEDFNRIPGARAICWRCKTKKQIIALPTWYPKVPDIIRGVSALERKAFDRQDVETLFGIQTAAAARLMPRLGAEKVAGRYSIPKPKLMSVLEHIQKTGRYEPELARRRTVAEQLQSAKEEQKSRAIAIPVKPQSRWKNLDELDGTTLQPGELRITFGDADQCMVRLYELGQAIGNDWEGFVQRIEVKKDMTA